jgi:hypothetical protein
MTSSQVSTLTLLKPSVIAVVTSGLDPYLNQSVKSRRVSCREFPGERAIDRKKAADPTPSVSLLSLLQTGHSP